MKFTFLIFAITLFACAQDPTPRRDDAEPTDIRNAQMDISSPDLHDKGLIADQGLHQDQDSDGVPDDEDNCPAGPNPDQSDMEDDGVGDECDSCPREHNTGVDCDNDGVDDICDQVDGPAILCHEDVDCPRGGQNGEFDVCIVPVCKEYGQCGIFFCNYGEDDCVE